MPQRYVDHFICRSHLKIEGPRQLSLQPGDIAIGNVTTIFPQVRGNSIRPTLDRNVGGAQRIRMPAAAWECDRRGQL